MYKKVLGLFLTGTLFFFCSCIDENYDLNKGVETDVKIQGNKLALPLGNLKAMKLDSLLSVEDNEMLSLMNGVYGISMEEEFDPITVDLDDITLALDPIDYSAGFDFQEVDIQNIHFDEIKEIIDLSTVTDFSLDEINKELPNLHAEQALHIINDGDTDLKKKIEDALAVANGAKEFSVEITNHKATINQEIACPLSYTLPKEVKSINTIVLSDRELGAESDKGILMKFQLDHPTYIHGMDMILSFEAVFPEMFHISIPEGGEYSHYTLINHHTVQIKDMPVHDENVILQVHLDSLTNIPHENGQISCDVPIVYTLSYYILKETITLDTDFNLDDLEIDISVDTQLGCRDIFGETNPISYNFEAQEFEFPIHIDDIEYINRIEYVDFDASKSQIRLETTMEHELTPLKLAENSYVELLIPKQIVLDEKLSNIPTGVEYKAEAHAFHIYDLDALYGNEWILALDKLIINKNITNGTLDIDDCKFVVRPCAEGVTIEGATVLLSEVLEKLDSKVEFSMKPIELHVENASLITDKIKAFIDEKVAFSLNEPIEKGLKRIKRVGLEEPVALNLLMDISGLENLDIIADLKFNITLPPFFSLTSKDEDVIVKENNVLEINKRYESGQTVNLSLEVDALDFSTIEGGCLAPKDSSDGKTYLQYDTDIEISGSAIVESTQLDLNILQNSIYFETQLCVEDIKIKEFIGLYSKEIDPVKGSVELDIDEDLNFWNKENSIKLSRPQIMIEFENPVNIGLLVDLLVEGSNNKVLIKKDAIKINAARYENGQITPSQTKLLITNKDVQMAGYHTIVLPDISDLLSDIPDSIHYSLTPRIDNSADQHIDLTQPINFSGKYSVVVPFEFDELNFIYSDTINDINADLGEITEMFTINELTLSMNIENTMPFELTLSPTALDEDGHKIGIDLSEIKIPAGNGQALQSDDTNSYPVSLSIKGDINEISRLDQIAFTVQLKGATETVGGIALRPEQGVHITKLSITVGGDIEFDLNEMNGEEEEE